MPNDWRVAMGLQARSDFELYKLLARTAGVARCHQLHYLQMSTEKLAKTFTTPLNGRPKTTHTRFVKFLESAKNRPDLRRYLGYGMNHHAFKTYIDTILPAAEAVESLHPESQMVRPNPEYPWEDRRSLPPALVIPCEYGFPNLDPRNEPLIKLMDFIVRCFQYLEKNPSI